MVPSSPLLPNQIPRTNAMGRRSIAAITFLLLAVSLAPSGPLGAQPVPADDEPGTDQLSVEWSTGTPEEFLLEADPAIANSDGRRFNTAEVISIADKFGLTEYDARRYLHVSAHLPLIVQTASNLFPDTFGGAWIPIDDVNSAVVAFTVDESTSMQLVLSSISALHAGDAFSASRVAHSRNQLLALRQELKDSWSIVRGFGAHALYTDLESNAIRILTHPGTDSSPLSLFLSQRWGADAPILIGETPPMQMLAKPSPATNCVTVYRRCNPVRGGMFLQLQTQSQFNDPTRCAMGFYAENSVGTGYVLTAGHCDNVSYYHSGDFLGGFSREAQAGQDPRSTDSQRQLLSTGTGWSRSNFVIHRSSNGSFDQDYRITGRYLGTAVNTGPGTALCVALPQTATQVGLQFGTQCGQVLVNDIMGESFDAAGVYAYTLDPVYGLAATGLPGDSGGPNYTSNRAYGLTSGGGNVMVGTLTYPAIFGTYIVEAERHLGLTVYTCC